MSKRRMIDADRLIEALRHERAGDPDLESGIDAAIYLVNRLATADSSCAFRNPGWEERAKETDHVNE